ncbi:hypothetical protein HPP92_026579 [Vanilla planifolia]|uniref:DUF4378 domain-containing protein n=1 Tax=Vanilla planifolia TaxID=51239 RepID=A0A835PDV5_VANPL|nr:hypothetical protein HPP92_026579 [Vanilla planifolia]
MSFDGQSHITNMNSSSGKSRILDFIGKRLLMRINHREKITPSSSRMMRTISIHHLEVNDFISTSELSKTSESSTSKFEPDFHENNILEVCNSALKKTSEAHEDIDAADDLHKSVDKLGKAVNELLEQHIVLKEKLIEMRDALLMQKGTDSKDISKFLLLSKLFLDTLELFHANREAIIDASEDPNYFSTSYLHVLLNHADKSPLTKPASLPGLECEENASGYPFPSHKHTETDSSITQGPKLQHGKSSVSIVDDCYNPEVLSDSHQLRKQREARTVLNRLGDFKQRIKDIIKENRQEKHRISRDGILHKVPFGHFLPESKEDGTLILQGRPALASHKESEGIKFNSLPLGSYGKFVQKRIQRSHSLTESLERYSQLFEPLAHNEPMMTLKLSKSYQEDNSLGHGRLSKKFGRMLSSIELRSYAFSKDVQNNVYHALKSSKMSTINGCEMKVTVDEQKTEMDSSMVVQKNHKKFNRTLSSPALRSFSVSDGVQGELFHDSQSFQTSKIPAQEPPGSEMEPTFDKAMMDTIISHAAPESTVNLCRVFSPVVQEFATEKEMESDTLVSAVEAKMCDTFVIASVDSITEMVASQPIAMSMGDCEHVVPYSFSVKEENEIISEPKTQTEAEIDVQSTKPSIIPFLNRNMEHDTISSTAYEAPDGYKEKHYNAELSMLDYGIGVSSEVGDALSSYTNNGHKHGNISEFVQYILWKRGYNMLDGKPNIFSSQLWNERYGTCDKPFEQVLYDLLNEVLLEINENSCAPNPWLLRFHSKIRSMPGGVYLLKDSWSEINWHLNSPQGLDVTLDDLIAYNFAKNHGWMNLYRDAECVGLQLELLILDGLVDEIVVESNVFL